MVYINAEMIPSRNKKKRLVVRMVINSLLMAEPLSS